MCVCHPNDTGGGGGGGGGDTVDSLRRFLPRPAPNLLVDEAAAAEEEAEHGPRVRPFVAVGDKMSAARATAAAAGYSGLLERALEEQPRPPRQQPPKPDGPANILATANI